MNSAWKIYQISDICKVYDGPHATPKKTEDGPFFLGISNLINGNIDLSGAEHLSEEDFIRWTKRVAPRKDDVVFSYETRLGEAAIIPENFRCCLGRRMGLMRPNLQIVDPRFLLYAFLGPEFQETIRSRTVHGSTVDRISINEFPSFPIKLPALSEQRYIASVLGSIDDKVNLNRRMNQTLESMVRTLFKSWFVDFDPVRAKADGRDPCLPAEIADLFPASFEESRMGAIPSGWRVAVLSDVCENIFSGGTPSTTNVDYWGGNIPWLSSGETGESFIIDTKQRITQQGVEGSSTRLARAGSSVIASAGQGKTRGQTSLLFLDTYVNQSVVVLKAGKPIDSDLFLFFDLSRRYEEFRQISDSHSSRGSLTTKLLADLRILVPPTPLIMSFNQAVKGMVEKIGHNLRESRTLVDLRDMLLPKLLNGEVPL